MPVRKVMRDDGFHGMWSFTRLQIGRDAVTDVANYLKSRSSGGRVVKLLAGGARGPGFDSRPRHLNFQRLVISCFQVEIWLKDR